MCQFFILYMQKRHPRNFPGCRLVMPCSAWNSVQIRRTLEVPDTGHKGSVLGTHIKCTRFEHELEVRFVRTSFVEPVDDRLDLRRFDENNPVTPLAGKLNSGRTTDISFFEAGFERRAFTSKFVAERIERDVRHVEPDILVFFEFRNHLLGSNHA